MFDNLGERITLIATILFILGIVGAIAGVIAALVQHSWLFFFIGLGLCAALIIGSQFVAAYGQLVDDVATARFYFSNIDQRLKDAPVQQAAAPAPASGSTSSVVSRPAASASRPAPLHGKWTCACGRVNNDYVYTCTCGRSKSSNNNTTIA